MGSEFDRLTRNSHTIVVSSESASAAERRTSDPSGVLVIIFHGRRHQKSRPRARARTARQTKKVMGKIGDMMILQIVAII